MLFSGLDDFFGLSDRSGFPRALGKKHLKEKSTRHWKFACSVSYPRLPPHSLYCSRWLGSSLSAETLFETLGLARDHGCGGHDVHGRGLEKPLTLPPYPCSLWHHRPWWKIITIVKLDPDLLHWDHHQHIITHSPPFCLNGISIRIHKQPWKGEMDAVAILPHQTQPATEFYDHIWCSFLLQFWETKSK